MTFIIPATAFREYDVRGVVGRELTDELAYHLGRAYATLAPPSSTIAVGRDCRKSGESLSQNLIRGLNDSGLNVFDLGVCPTPLTYFSAFHYDVAGTIMVTGSHNPPEYNGFKIGLDRKTIFGEAIQNLRNLVERSVRGDFPISKNRGNTTLVPIIEPYLKWVTQNAKPNLEKKRVVIDAGNGTAGNVAPLLLRALGAEVIELYCELDGSFPNHHPDPTVHENLEDLIQKVRETGADFGLAFDGDSDRLGVVDEKGRPFFGDELMVVFSRALLQERPGTTIISEVKSSNRLFDDIHARGGKPLMWKTGHSIIKAKMKETGALLAGEMSGHIFFADRYFGFDDGIYAALRFYEIAAQSPAAVSTFIRGLPDAVATPELRLDCPDEKKFLVVERARTILGQRYPISTVDGVRVDFGGAWGLVRASNTQPVLVLRFEAPNERRLLEIRRETEAIVNEALRSS
jgi:phosphomannomutase/phosphoglucomutase